jgi:hypothetical protein
MHAGIDHPDSSVTELPLNIEDLRRYSRQQRQEITSRLKNFGRESSDQAFSVPRAACARLLMMKRADVGAKSYRRERYEPDTRRGRTALAEQLRTEAERRADNYAAAVAEYQKKKAEAALRQVQKRGCETRRSQPGNHRQHRRAAA